MQGLRLATQQLCTCITLFWYLSLQSLHDYHVILTKLGSLSNDGKKQQKKEQKATKKQ